MEFLKCSNCKETKESSYFYTYRKSTCKKCLIEKSKKNKSKKNKSKPSKDYVRIYFYINSIKIVKYVKYKNNHIAYIKEKLKKARKIELSKTREENAKEKRRIYSRLHRKGNHKEKVRKIISKAIRNGGYSKDTNAYNILGCDFDIFRKHIENNFLSGMTWDNHGLYGWHYDHIIPLATAKNYEDIVRLNHYTNIRPLWAKDNLKKSDNIIDHQIKFAF